MERFFSFVPRIHWRSAGVLVASILLFSLAHWLPVQARPRLAPPTDDLYVIHAGAFSNVTNSRIDTDDDLLSGAGAECTLRDALDVVNLGATTAIEDDPQGNGCNLSLVGTAPPDPIYRINLPSGSYTYTLDGTFLDISPAVDMDVYIVGNTTNNTIIDGDDNSGVFEIDGTGIDLFVEISTLTIQDGVTVDGGGIYDIDTDLTLLNVTVTSNEATGDGGGIYHDGTGTLTLSGVTVSGNEAAVNGGGIFANGGTVSITGSSTLGGAATANANIAAGDGGGLYNNGAAVTINSSSVTGPSSATGQATNGGGIYNTGGGTVNITSSSVTNLRADTSGGAIYNDPGATMNLTGVTLTGNRTTNSDGGGIYNEGTLNILSGSAIGGAGTAANRAADGTANGGGIFNTGTLVLDNSSVRGDSTANNVALNGGGIFNTGTASVQNSSLITANQVGEDGGGIFNSGTLNVLTGTDITNNIAQGAVGGGGGIYNDAGTVTISGGLGTAITGNRAVNANGGGIYTDGGTVTTNGALDDNDAEAANSLGGGLYAAGGATVTFNGGRVSANTASRGGGIYKTGAATGVTLTAATVNTNTAAAGGGIYNNDGDLTINPGSAVNSNRATGATGDGGGIYIENTGAGGVTISGGGTSLNSNTADRSGGAIYHLTGGLDLTDVTVSANTATSGDGGGIYTTGGTPSITGGAITGNRAQNGTNGRGGGIYSNATLALSDVNMTGNAARQGGGLYIQGNTTTVTGTASQINSNTASNSGAGIYLNSGGITATDLIISSNNANQTGGGIFVAGGTASFSSVLFNSNRGSQGGGVFNSGGAVTINGQSQIVNNNAGSNGGALFHAAGATSTTVNDSCITNNTGAASDFENASATTQDAEDNWWGGATGVPGSSGADTADANVDADPITTDPALIALCGIIPTPIPTVTPPASAVPPGNATLSVDASPNSPEPGDVVTCEFTFRNDTGVPLTNVQVVVPIDGDADYDSATQSISPSGSGTWSITRNAGNTQVTFNIAVLPSGTTSTLRVRQEVDNDADDGTDITCRGTPTADLVTFSPTSAEDTVEVQVDNPTSTPRPTTAPTSTSSGGDSGGSGGDEIPDSGGPDELPDTGIMPIPPGFEPPAEDEPAPVDFEGIVAYGTPSRVAQLPGSMPLLVIVVTAFFVVSGLGVLAWGVLLFRGMLEHTFWGNQRNWYVLVGSYGLLLALAVFIGAVAASFPGRGDRVTVAQIVEGGNVAVSYPGGRGPGAIAPTDDITIPDALRETPQPRIVYAPPDKPATRIAIPSLAIDTELVMAQVVNEAWDVSTFEAEIAHLDGTAFLGTNGNAVLAGHVRTERTSQGVFRNLDDLKLGDLIIASGDGVEYIYSVTWIEEFDPTALAVTKDTGKPVLTLVTCSNWSSESWSYERRIVIRAELIEVEAL